MGRLDDAPDIALAEEREFGFTTADFERVRQLIYRHAGIALTPIKQNMVYNRLARRLRATGCASFAEYLARLETGRDDSGEMEVFVNALTTNLTAFFREAHHFDILTRRLQQLGERRTTGQPIRIWCAASSTGEEPYSLAMTACAAFGTLTPPVSIIASDIDTQVLTTAANGIYPLDRVEKLGPERLKNYFLKGTGTRAGHVRVRPELQRLVRFCRVNLLDARWPEIQALAPLDIIFCRNVMIYFDKDTQYRILAKFSPLLTENGLLFAGHSESFMHAADLFRSLGRTVYERTKQHA
jgi:chemotaxis protein methyltransferase CheR